MIGVILAAGEGKRFRSGAGKDNFKVLKKVNGLHLIEFALNNLAELGIGEACIVVGEQGERIRQTIGCTYKGIQITYLVQKRPLGLINAFAQALAVVRGRDVLLQLGDEIFLGLKTEKIREQLAMPRGDFFCGITCEDDPAKIRRNYSVETDEDLCIKHCVEKPSVVINNMKGTGFCIFRRDALQILESSYEEENNTPRELCDYINALVARGKTGVALCVAEKEFNINTPEELEEAERALGKQ